VFSAIEVVKGARVGDGSGVIDNATVVSTVTLVGTSAVVRVVTGIVLVGTGTAVLSATFEPLFPKINTRTTTAAIITSASNGKIQIKAFPRRTGFAGFGSGGA
jgi:ascorbate-specific PTS system EIIC-type component UlaA